MAGKKGTTISVTRGSKKPSRASTPEHEREDASGGLDAWPAEVAHGAREVWLAGLGMLSVVEDQSTKLFRALVEEGKRWERERRMEADEAVKQAAAETGRVATSATEAIGEQVVRRVREGVDTTLDRVGAPTRSALEDLRRQVDELAQKADRLTVQLEEADGNGSAA